MTETQQRKVAPSHGVLSEAETTVIRSANFRGFSQIAFTHTGANRCGDSCPFFPLTFKLQKLPTMTLHKSLTMFAVCCSTIVLVGCGGGAGYEGPQRAEITGAVTLDGKPLEDGSIAFQPRNEDQKPAGGIIAGGQYKIPEGKGPTMGEYDVYITAMGETKEVPVIDGGEETGEFEVVGEQLIPKKYNEETELNVNVTESVHEFNFDLKSN